MPCLALGVGICVYVCVGGVQSINGRGNTKSSLVCTVAVCVSWREWHYRICRYLWLLTCLLLHPMAIKVEPRQLPCVLSPGHDGSHGQRPLGTMQRAAIWVTCSLT